MHTRDGSSGWPPRAATNLIFYRNICSTQYFTILFWNWERLLIARIDSRQYSRLMRENVETGTGINQVMLLWQLGFWMWTKAPGAMVLRQPWTLSFPEAGSLWQKQRPEEEPTTLDGVSGSAGEVTVEAGAGQRTPLLRPPTPATWGGNDPH